MSTRGLVLCFIGALLHWSTAFGQRSPFNGLEVLPADSTGHYRILIGGHFHGESTNRSGYPAATLLANLDTINNLGANLFLSTGDLFMDAEKDSARYARAFFSKLKVPFFNAPGNHDIDGAVATPLPAPFSIHPPGNPFCLDRFVVIDTEEPDLEVMADKIKQVLDFVSIPKFTRIDPGQAVSQVFIFSHRPIWAEDDPQYSDLFKDNTRSLTGTNFQKDVYPILQEIAKHADVYWISGSLGGGAPSSIFFQEHAPNNLSRHSGITYIQCAIRDEPRDALLIADVYPDSVKWSALSLTGQHLQAPETYNAAWWRKQRGEGEGFNWRLLPYKMKVIVTHRAFWWGAACALLIVFVVRRFLRR